MDLEVHLFICFCSTESHKRHLVNVVSLDRLTITSVAAIIIVITEAKTLNK